MLPFFIPPIRFISKEGFDMIKISNYFLAGTAVASSSLMVRPMVR